MADKKDDLAFTVKKRWSYYKSKYSSFISRADEDIRFYRGDQWDYEVKKEREDNGKPVITKNRIKPKVNLMKGIQRQNRYFFKVIPSDTAPNGYEEVARDINARLKKIESENDGEYEISDCFQEGIEVGRSYLEVFIREDKSILPYKRDILFKQRSYNRVFVDPDSIEYDLSDARDYFIVSEFSREALKEMFPDKSKEINGITSSENENWIIDSDDDGVQKEDYDTQGDGDADSGDKEDSLLMKEYYYFKKVKKRYFVNTSGVYEEVGDREAELEAIHSRLKAEADKREGVNYDYKFLDVEKKKWRVCVYIGDLKIEEKEMPIDEPHIAAYFPDRVKSTKELEKKDIGIIKDMKGLQEEYNLLSSQTLAHLNSSVNGGIAYEDGAIENLEKWQKLGSTSGFLGKIEKGYWGKWERLNPAQLSAGHMTLAKDSAAELDEVTNIRPDLMGANAGDKSGRALALQQQQGFMGINFYFDNFRRTKHLLARKLVKMICFIEGWEFENLKLEIDDTAESPTQRYANFLETKELFESGALDSPYGDLIIEGMNITNKDKYIQRFNEISEFKKAKAQLEQQAMQLQEKEAQLMQFQAQESPQAKAEAEQLAIQDAMEGR